VGCEPRCWCSCGGVALGTPVPRLGATRHAAGCAALGTPVPTQRGRFVRVPRRVLLGGCAGRCRVSVPWRVVRSTAPPASCTPSRPCSGSPQNPLTAGSGGSSGTVHGRSATFWGCVCLCKERNQNIIFTHPSGRARRGATARQGRLSAPRPRLLALVRPPLRLCLSLSPTPIPVGSSACAKARCARAAAR
jgi:hypothetical protein